MLDKLVRMANKPDEQSRNSMAFQLAEIFVNNPQQISEEAKDDFGYIIRHVVARQSDKVAERLAQALCNTNQLDDATASQFANSDAIEVAKPMLQFSPSVKDETLLQIIETKSENHRKIIANRNNLSENVSNAISLHSEAPALQVLANNETAKLSGISVGNILTRTSRGSGAAKSLVSRLTNDNQLAKRIQKELSAELRRRLSQEGFSAELINFQIESEAAQEEVEKHIREERLQTVDAMVAKARIESSQASTESEIRSALESDNFLTAIRILSFGVDLAYEQAATALSEEDPSTLSIFCRAANISKQTHEMFERARCKFFNFDPEKAAEVAIIAENMEREAAIEMVESLASQIQNKAR